MDEITKRAYELEQKIISAINESQLHPVIGEYVLRNILLQYQNAQLQQTETVAENIEK